jgi:hypothetical protein
LTNKTLQQADAVAVPRQKKLSAVVASALRLLAIDPAGSGAFARRAVSMRQI